MRKMFYKGIRPPACPMMAMGKQKWVENSQFRIFCGKGFIKGFYHKSAFWWQRKNWYIGWKDRVYFLEKVLYKISTTISPYYGKGKTCSVSCGKGLFSSKGAQLLEKHVQHPPLSTYCFAEPLNSPWRPSLACIKSTSKAVSPFMSSRSRYQCGCVTLINQISTEAVMWLLSCGCICVTNALLM